MNTSKYTSDDVNRFWSKVNKDGSIPMHCPELGQCWEWIPPLRSNGYGQFRLKHGMISPHRASWELANGEIPARLFVLHKCDNRACVNPKHLFVGTALDNVRDMLEKGRGKPPSGEKHFNHKLTASQVDEIRQRIAAGEISQGKLAKEMGVNQSQISYIVNRKFWK